MRMTMTMYRVMRIFSQTRIQILMILMKNRMLPHMHLVFSIMRLYQKFVNASAMPLYPLGSHVLLEILVKNPTESSQLINGTHFSLSSYLWCFQSYGWHQESTRIQTSSTIFTILSCARISLARIQYQTLLPTITFNVTSDIVKHPKPYFWQ